MIIHIKQACCGFILVMFAAFSYANQPIFLIQLEAGSTLPTTEGLYDAPVAFSFIVDGAVI